MKVTGTVTVDLRSVTEAHAQLRLVQGAAEAPACSHVVLKVPRGLVPPVGGIEYLRVYGAHLGRLDVQGDPATVRLWVDALREGVHL